LKFEGEIAQKEIRGFLTGMLEWSASLGIFFTYVVGAFVNVFWLSVICSIFPIIYTVIFLFMPESPTYLINKNREVEARKSFRFLRGKAFDPTDEIQEILKEKEEKSKISLTFLQAFSRKSSMKALSISLLVIIFQQFSGILAVLSYTTKIFQSANTDLNDDLQTIIVGATYSSMLFLATFFIDKCGRRKLMLVSGTGITICHVALAIFFYLQENDEDNVKNLGWLPITALTFFIIFFASGVGPIPCIIIGEILPIDIKGRAAGIIWTSNSFAVFLVTKFFPTLVVALGSGSTFTLFAALCVIGTILVSAFVPETKGKSLFEIQKML
jgi:hypothetical protein